MYQVFDSLARIPWFENMPALSFVAGCLLGVLVTLAGWKTFSAVHELVRRAAAFGWHPSASYLVGSRRKKRK